MHMAHDSGIKIVNRILVACSMCLSGYFGWVLGEGVFPLNIVLAVMCAAVAYGVSLMFERAAGYNILGLRSNAIICWAIGTLFLCANTLFDYSSAAAVRDAVATAATNANNKASDARAQVDLLRKNISDAKATSAWQAALQPPSAYEGIIRNLEGNATIMKRSKGCQDQTLPDTKDHCQKITDAKANLAMAQQREVTSRQISKWEQELGQATSKADTTDFNSNPALAQVRAVTSWFKLDRNLTDTNIFWGQNAIMLLMTVLVNACLAFLGNELGTTQAMMMRGQGYEPPPGYQLALAGPQQPPGPQPLRATDAPVADHGSGNGWDRSETIILSGGHHGAAHGHGHDPDPARAEIMTAIEDANDAVSRKLADMKRRLEKMQTQGSA